MLIAAGETRGEINKNTTTQNGLNQPTINYDKAFIFNSFLTISGCLAAKLVVQHSSSINRQQLYQAFTAFISGLFLRLNKRYKAKGGLPPNQLNSLMARYIYFSSLMSYNTNIS
ncbi:MAG: hypothetical protein JEZ14_19650 [Marinilabiliaceae bacterium]|nr:hypothetical protein [Marinilabiliaceae bacterium]